MRIDLLPNSIFACCFPSLVATICRLSLGFTPQLPLVHVCWFPPESGWSLNHKLMQHKGSFSEVSVLLPFPWSPAFCFSFPRVYLLEIIMESFLPLLFHSSLVDYNSDHSDSTPFTDALECILWIFTLLPTLGSGSIVVNLMDQQMELWTIDPGIWVQILPLQLEVF